MITFKNKEDIELFATLHPKLLLVFMDLYNYALDKFGVSLVVTQTVSTKENDLLLKRQSPAHTQHRAIDIRTIGMDKTILNDLLKYINEKEEYKKLHYATTTGLYRLAYYHVGTAEHIHLAIHSRYKT